MVLGECDLGETRANLGKSVSSRVGIGNGRKLIPKLGIKSFEGTVVDSSVDQEVLGVIAQAERSAKD